MSFRKRVAKKIYLHRFKIFTVIVMKGYIWDIKPGNPFNINRRFVGRRHVHFRGRRIGQRDSSSFLPALFFEPQGIGSMFLRKVGWRLTATRRYNPVDVTQNIIT